MKVVSFNKINNNSPESSMENTKKSNSWLKMLVFIIYIAASVFLLVLITFYKPAKEYVLHIMDELTN